MKNYEIPENIWKFMTSEEKYHFEEYLKEINCTYTVVKQEAQYDIKRIVGYV